MELLLDHLNKYHTISREAQYALRDNFEEIALPKNELLLQEGRICRHLYFVQQGCLRGYYNLNGKEVTHWFGFEDDFVTSFHSFITQKPAIESIQLMENSVLWAISKDKLTALYNQHHEIERLVRIVYEQYYIRLEERYVNAQFKTALELYENLITQTPHIVERVPLGYIASFLGMSQETLSRVRNRL